MTDKPRRRWFQFSLGTTFVVVTVAAVFISCHVNWIRQRHEYRSRRGLRFDVEFVGYPIETPAVPAALWLLGENGVANVHIPTIAKSAQSITGDDRSKGREARRLSPEARIWLRTRYWVAPLDLHDKDAPATQP